jgi:subtilisin family serine protease
MFVGLSMNPIDAKSDSRIDNSSSTNVLSEKTDSTISNELILLWNSDVKQEDKLALINSYQDQISIVRDFENFMLISTDSEETAAQIYSDLSNSSLLTAIDYNQETELAYTKDPYSTAQWGHENPGYYAQLVGDELVNLSSAKDVDLNIPAAWSLYNKKDINTREVVVAVIDTGVDNNHPDLVNSMWVNKKETPGDGIDNDKNGYIDDIFGWDFYNDDNTVCHYEMDVKTEEIRASSDDNDDHGTHCAGIIAATANNNIGIAGIASNIDVKIMALKIHGGPNGKGTIADAILAIKYATAMGADVVNLSWGSSVYSKALEQTIAQAPMLFVTAAGNTGDNNDNTPMYPANYALPNVMSVTFINEFGALTTKSNYGKKTVDIAAPGMNILSTVVGGYETLSGSSMAAPHITGLAAILYSCSNRLSPKSVKDVIVMNVKPLVSLRGSVAVAGIPDAYMMVQSMAYLVVDTKSPTLNINTYFDQSKIMLGLYPKDQGNSGIRVIRYLSGKKSVKSFKNGTSGTEIKGDTISLNKGGLFTFYISDYAGNENTYTYNVIDDSQAPSIATSFRYSIDNKAITLNYRVIDELSDVKMVRYVKGKKTVSDFTSGNLGTVLTVKDGSNTLRLTQSGEYTFYAVDYRGNKTVHVVNIALKPITTLSLTESSHVLAVDETYKIKLTYAPTNTTDKIFFISSNPSVVSVSQWGNLHARSQGKAVITIRTSSGLIRKVLITVN